MAVSVISGSRKIVSEAATLFSFYSAKVSCKNSDMTGFLWTLKKQISMVLTRVQCQIIQRASLFAVVRDL
jgi:hypothetical protein